MAKKKWDIPHIPLRPNIPKNNVLPLWQKKWDIQVVCQYPEIITMFDVADFKQHMSMIFFFIIYNWCTCSLQIFTINIDRSTERIQKAETIRVIRLRIY